MQPKGATVQNQIRLNVGVWMEKEEWQSVLSAHYELQRPASVSASEHQGKNNQVVVVQSGSTKFIGKNYLHLSDVGSLEYQINVIEKCRNMGLSFNIPESVKTRHGADYCKTKYGWLVLMPMLCGQQLDVTISRNVDLYGHSLGELHATLERLPKIRRPGRSLFGDLLEFGKSDFDARNLKLTDLNVSADNSHQDILTWWKDEYEVLGQFLNESYAQLPKQICHNDFSPSNILLNDEEVSAVLDFEFADLASRALDFAMGIRMSARVWFNPFPWETVDTFARGYKNWIQLSEKELSSIPMLIRLRGCLTTLWWLARLGLNIEGQRIVQAMKYQQNFATWEQKNGEMLVNVLMNAFEYDLES